jgi:hypothetical protein
MTIDEAKKILEKIFLENENKESSLLQGIENEKKHAYLTLAWTEKLNPKASLFLKIAALFHDIDRILVKGVGGGFKGTQEEYKKFKKIHAQRCADCIQPILIEKGLLEQEAERVSFLIAHHDDERQQLDQIKDEELEVLVAADALAFFDTFGIRTYQKRGMTLLEEKIKFMALKMAPQYRKVLVDLKINDNILQNAKDKIVEQFF